MTADRLPSRRDRHATTRALACLAASLLAVNLAFVLWPDPSVSTGVARATAEREQIAIELIDPTQQAVSDPSAPPPPPPPPVEIPPEEVPDEVLIEQVEEIVEEFQIDVPELPTPRPSPRPAPPSISGPPAPPAPPAPAPAADRIVDAPDRSPRLRGQALPVYPRDGGGFRGRARVRVLVNAGGQVTEALVVERVAFDGDRETAVPAFPDAFERAVLDAAHRHLFSPARDGGERVRAYAFLTISLDPPE